MWRLFDLVGVTERFDEFLLLLSDMVGPVPSPLHPLPHLLTPPPAPTSCPYLLTPHPHPSPSLLTLTPHSLSSPSLLTLTLPHPACPALHLTPPHTPHQVGLPHPAYRSQLVDRISATASAMRVRSPLVT